MPDQLTAEEVEEHLAAGGVIGKEHEQARREITRACELLKRGHITLHYNCMLSTAHIAQIPSHNAVRRRFMLTLHIGPPLLLLS